MQDGDQVLVAPILPQNEKTVYIEGHVFRPGKYAFRDGMTVNDLLRSYQDVMPEPSNHAEIIRLQPPDFRPATISFDLSEILSGDDPINLQPFDVIRVFSRYEIDAPKVSIVGEVLRPGKYPLESGMTVSALVNMAGGFKRSAYRETADLASYVVQEGQNVRTEEKLVNLDDALEGDKGADVVLKPGDVLSIRQLTGWTDIGASVRVNGEVAHAGSYGITQGERLSSVLKRAGGFRESAYPFGAVLERVQVREIGEKTRREMIRRLESTPINFSPGLTDAQERQSTMQSMQQQQQQIVASLRRHPASGRQVIRISRRHFEVGEYARRYRNARRRCAHHSQAPDFCFGGRTGLQPVRDYLCARQDRAVVSAAGGRADRHGEQEVHLRGAGGRLRDWPRGWRLME